MHATRIAGNSKPLLVQMGDGGNIEGLYQTYVDQPGACPYNATTAKSSVASYQVCLHPHVWSGLSIAVESSVVCAWTRLCAMLTAIFSLAARSLPFLAGLRKFRQWLGP